MSDSDLTALGWEMLEPAEKAVGLLNLTVFVAEQVLEDLPHMRGIQHFHVCRLRALKAAAMELVGDLSHATGRARSAFGPPEKG